MVVIWLVLVVISAIILYVSNEIVSILAVAEICCITAVTVFTVVQRCVKSVIEVLGQLPSHSAFLVLHFICVINVIFIIYFVTLHICFSLLLSVYHFIFNTVIHQLFLSVHSPGFIMELFRQSFPPERLSCIPAEWASDYTLPRQLQSWDSQLVPTSNRAFSLTTMHQEQSATHCSDSAIC